MEVLYENELSTVTASFNGRGDSGTIDSFYATDIDAVIIGADELASILLPDCVPKNINQFGQWTNGGWQPRNFKSQPLTLLEFIDLVFSEELEMAHDGWEINAGSSGTITARVSRHKNGTFDSSNSARGFNISIDYASEEEEYEDS